MNFEEKDVSVYCTFLFHRFENKIAGLKNGSFCERAWLLSNDYVKIWKTGHYDNIL